VTFWDFCHAHEIIAFLSLMTIVDGLVRIVVAVEKSVRS